MMRINLLPVKAARKNVSARQELLILVGVLGIVAAALFSWYAVTEAELSSVIEKIGALKAELETVQKEVARVQEFKSKAELLERKLKVIDELKKKKIGPARMLDELATILTDAKKVWLVRLDEKDGTLTLEGGAMEQANISDFQIALGKSKLFLNIKLNLVAAQKKGGIGYLEWKMTCRTNYTAS